MHIEETLDLICFCKRSFQNSYWIKKKKYMILFHIKHSPQAAQRLIDDYKAVMDDVMTTGQDLMSISTRYDAAGVQRSVDHVSNRYLMVKQAVRSKLALLDEALRRLSADV